MVPLTLSGAMSDINLILRRVLSAKENQDETVTADVVKYVPAVTLNLKLPSFARFNKAAPSVTTTTPVVPVHAVKTVLPKAPEAPVALAAEVPITSNFVS